MKYCLLRNIVSLIFVAAVACGSVISVTPGTAGCGINDASHNQCLAYVQTALDTSCASQCVVHFAAGKYFLFPKPFSNVWNIPHTAVNVSITGSASPGSAPATEFILSDISNMFQAYTSSSLTLHFSHFSVDMARLPYTFGVVQSANTFLIPSWASPNPVFAVNETLWPWLSVAQALNSYFAEQGRWTYNVDDYMLSAPATLSYARQVDGSILVSVTGAESLAGIVGQYVIARHQVYSFQVWTIQGHVDLSIQHVDVYSIAGMGLYCDRCGDVIVDYLRISPPRGTSAVPPALTYRPASINADGVHVVNQNIASKFEFTNGHIEGQGDDCINVNTGLAEISSVSADGKTIVATGYSNSFPFQLGDTVNLMDGETLQFKSQVVPTSFDFSDTSITNSAPWGARVGDIIYPANAITSNGVVRNSYFGRNRARALLLRGISFHVSGNTFDRVSGPAMFAPVDGCDFYEGPFLYNLFFENNTLVAVNAGACSQYGAVAAVPQVRQFVNGAPVPNTCVQATVSSDVNITVVRNSFIHNVFGYAPLPTLYIATTTGVVASGNNIARYSMPSLADELVCVDCFDAEAQSNTCNGAACTSTGF